MGFILGGYVPYDLIPYSVLLSISYVVIILLYIPETPQHLIKHGNKEVSADKIPAIFPINQNG